MQADLPAAAGAGTYGRATKEAAAMLLAKLYLNAEVYTGTPRVRPGPGRGAAGDRGAVQRSTPAIGTCSRRTTTRRPRSSSPIIQDGLNTQTFGGTTFLIHAACGGP